jgi:hypothetical protein
MLNHYGNFWNQKKNQMENDILTGYSSNEVMFISESDLMVFLEAVENPAPPNDVLKDAAKKYKKFIPKSSEIKE